MELHSHEKLIIGCFRDLDGRVRLQDLCKRVVRKQFPQLGKSQPKTAGHYGTTEKFLERLVARGLVQEDKGKIFSLTQKGRLVDCG